MQSLENTVHELAHETLVGHITHLQHVTRSFESTRRIQQDSQGRSTSLSISQRLEIVQSVFSNKYKIKRGAKSRRNVWSTSWRLDVKRHTAK